MHLTLNKKLCCLKYAARCTLLVSFNSTKRLAQSFIVSYVGYRFIIALMLFCCLFGVTLDFWSKYFVVVSRQQTPPLTTSDKYHNLPRLGGTVLITSSWSQRWQHEMKPDIGSKSRFLLTPPPASVAPFGEGAVPVEIRHDVWYRKNQNGVDGEKSLKICLFVLTESTNVTDRHTDT